MVSNWKRKHTITLLVLVAFFVLLGAILGPVGPKYMFDRAVNDPKAEDAGVWMLRAANLYEYTMRKDKANKAYLKYLELFNEDTHEEKKHYYNRDEYIWTMYNQLNNMESLSEWGYQGEAGRNRYKEALERTEDLDENHSAIVKFKNKIRSWH